MNKRNVIGAIGLALILAVAVISQSRGQQEPAWANTARQLSARQPAVQPSAVILRLDEVAYIVNGEYVSTGQAVVYATVSKGGPTITNDMNAADAIALAVADGRKCIHSQYGFMVFATQ